MPATIPSTVSVNTYSPSMEEHTSWESPANTEVHDITVVLCGTETHKAAKWLETHPRFSIDIRISDSFQNTRELLNTQNIDICITDSGDENQQTRSILEYIEKYKMACATIVLSDGDNEDNDDIFYHRGATDVCHYYNFDQTTLTHIIHNVYLRAKTSYQYQQEINRMSSHLLNMAHELKNPLNAILGFSQLLEKSLTHNITTNEERNLKRIINNSKRIRQLINELLDLGTISSDKIELKIVDVNICKVINDVFEQQKIYADNHDLYLRYSASEVDSQSFIIQADPLRLYQIVSNLVSNALKYTESGGVTVSLSWACDKTRQLKFEVQDTGIGIQDSDLPAIFDQYQRVAHTLNKEVDSTGLGLPITLELVKQHQGHISVTSERGKGSTFSVLLPEKYIA